MSGETSWHRGERVNEGNGFTYQAGVSGGGTCSLSHIKNLFLIKTDDVVQWFGYSLHSGRALCVGNSVAD